jgi:DNA-binding SARP family transcriptional activator
MDALWSNARPSVIEKNFHPTISFLRRALNHGHRITKSFILLEHGAYLLNPAYRYEIDIESFEEGVRAARGRVQRGDPEGAIAAFSAALSLYRGPFMEEDYADWVEVVRTNLEALRRSALRELSDLHLQSGDPEAGISRLRESLALDPIDEAASARLMRALGTRADRTGVEAEWRRISSELSRQAGARPSLETRRAYDAASRRPPT